MVARKPWTMVYSVDDIAYGILTYMLTALHLTQLHRYIVLEKKKGGNNGAFWYESKK